MFCLVTDLLHWREYPAPELAALYKWRWDGSETALREAKASLDGAGPSAGPMLRSGSPDLVRQELAAWAAAVEMTRGVARDAALAAIPAKKGRRAGQPVQPREISCARTRRAILAAIRAGRTSYTALTSAIGNPGPSPAEPAPCPQGEMCQHLPARQPRGHHHPHRRSRHNHGQQPGLTSTNTHNQARPDTRGPIKFRRAPPGTTRRLSACPHSGTTHRYQNREPPTNAQMPKAHGIAGRALGGPGLAFCRPVGRLRDFPAQRGTGKTEMASPGISVITASCAHSNHAKGGDEPCFHRLTPTASPNAMGFRYLTGCG